MLELLRNIVFANLYWFALPLAGYGLLRLMVLLLTGVKWVQEIGVYTLDRPVPTKVLLGFVTMVAVLSVPIVFCYVFGASATLFTCIFVLLVGIGLSYYLLQAGRYLAWLRNVRPQHMLPFLKKNAIIISLLLLVAADAIVALYVRGYALVSADTYVHLSRIVSILDQGFNVQSGFFSALPETGYHINAIYALYVPFAQLFNTSPAILWEFSLAFFRIIVWCGVFILAHHVFSEWVKTKRAVSIACFTTAFAVMTTSGSLLTASYPSSIATIWIVLLIISLSYYRKGRLSALISAVISALLVSVTHPLSALMCILFGCLLLALIVIFDRKSLSPYLKVLGGYASVGVALMVGPLRTALFENGTTANGISVTPADLLHMGPFVLQQPAQFWTYPTSKIVLVALGLIGMLYLLYVLRKNRAQLLLVIALITFYPLVAFFPPIFTVLHNALPIWAIERFASMNVLLSVAAPLGLYALWQQIKYRKIVKQVGRLGLSLGAMAFALLIVAIYTVPTYRVQLGAHAENQHNYELMMRTHEAFKNKLNDDALVIATPGDGYLINSVLPVDVMAIEQGHMTPAADSINRLSCQKTINADLRYADLKSVNARYVILAKYELTYLVQKNIADSLSYLRSVGSSQDYDLYKFLPEDPGAAQQDPSTACVEYQRNERL